MFSIKFSNKFNQRTTTKTYAIPGYIGYKYPNLNYLDLGHDKLITKTPQSFGQLFHLQFLDIFTS